MDIQTPRYPLWIPIFLVFLAGGAYLTGKYIESQDLSPVIISVQGEGRVFANPDIAQITFGVETGRQSTAEKAMNVLSENMNKVFEAVKAQGVEEKDITTASLSLNPAYDWNEGARIDRGFEARQSLSIKVRDIAAIGEVLSAATAAGANQAGGISFTIDDPEELYAAARIKAIDRGEEKARTLAQQLGKQLGKLRNFSEGGVVPTAMYRNVQMDMAEASGMGGGGPVSTPLPAGEQEITVTVYLGYELR
ncbi:MAG: SIMPL domain-containing protein [Candidatus Peribacteraceae bacterium]|jgi:hypothetical protein